MENERQAPFVSQLQNMFTDLLRSTQNPDNEVTFDTLKTIIKGSLGERYTEGQLNNALEELGVPKNGVIKVHEFCAQLATPSAYAMKDDSLGNWLSTEEWQNVFERLGVSLTLSETDILLKKTKEQTIDEVARERLALEKIGIELTNDDLKRIISDAQKTASSFSSDDSEYETEEEIIVTE